MYGNACMTFPDMDYVALFEKYLGPGRRSGRNIAFPCPRCDIGRPGKRHLYLNPTTGLYKCYKCMSHPDGHGKGNAFQFAKMMGEIGLLLSTDTKKYERPNHFDQSKATEVYTYLCNTSVLSDADSAELERKRGLQRPYLELSLIHI